VQIRLAACVVAVVTAADAAGPAAGADPCASGPARTAGGGVAVGGVGGAEPVGGIPSPAELAAKKTYDVPKRVIALCTAARTCP
jgi:hypothetical protein